MTLVPVTVIDQFGRNVTGLNKQNFKIYDGSEERPIATFGLQDAAVSRIEFIELFGSDIATGAPVCERVRL